MDTNEILSRADEYLIAIIIGAAIALILNIFIAAKFGAIAKDKGYSFGTHFAFCFFFSVIGWIAVWALPDKNTRRTLEKIARNLIPPEKEQD